MINFKELQDKVIKYMVNLIVIDIIKSGSGQPGNEPKSKIVLRDFSVNVMEESVNDFDISSQNIKVGDQVHFEMNQIVKNTN